MDKHDDLPDWMEVTEHTRWTPKGYPVPGIGEFSNPGRGWKNVGLVFALRGNAPTGTFTVKEIREGTDVAHYGLASTLGSLVGSGCVAQVTRGGHNAPSRWRLTPKGVRSAQAWVAFYNRCLPIRPTHTQAPEQAVPRQDAASNNTQEGTMIENKTYGEIAATVRDVMRALDVAADDAPRVYALARVAVGKHASTISAWCVAALVVPDCTKLPPMDREWTPAWPQHVPVEDVVTIREVIAMHTGGGQ